MNGTQKKKIIDLLFKLQAVKESWILAMLSRDSGHFSNLRRNRENSQTTDKKVTLPRPEIIL